MKTFKTFPLNDAELGFLFYQKRTKKRITLEKASNDVKLSKTALGRFENGNQFLSVKKIITYANYLELDLKFCIEE